jgi:hypothetical protein
LFLAYINKQTIPFDKGPKRPVPFELLRLCKLLLVHQQVLFINKFFCTIKINIKGFSPFGKEINAHDGYKDHNDHY